MKVVCDHVLIDFVSNETGEVSAHMPTDLSLGASSVASELRNDLDIRIT